MRTASTRFFQLKQWGSLLLCCSVLALGIRHAALSFLGNVHHPGWDFVIRHGEVACLASLHIDPYDVYLGAVEDKDFRPYYFDYQRQEQNPLDNHWVFGYPPWEYTVLLPMSALPVKMANGIFRAMELLSVFGICLFAFKRSRCLPVSEQARLVVASAVFLLPPESWEYAFRYDNWTLLFCMGVVAFLVSLENGWPIVAGLAWAFLMIKPQQGIWFAIPIFVKRQFKTGIVAVVICLTASIPPSVLCGKTPYDLIVEIPKFRAQKFLGTTLFPAAVYRFFDDNIFPNAALFAGLLICFVFCAWSTWKIRRTQNWFLLLQPTFFCLVAGYPPWLQDWLLFFFPLLFVLELCARRDLVPFRTRVIALLLAVAISNPISWGHFDFSMAYGSPWADASLYCTFATWSLFAFLIFILTRHDSELPSCCYFSEANQTSNSRP